MSPGKKEKKFRQKSPSWSFFFFLEIQCETSVVFELNAFRRQMHKYKYSSKTEYKYMCVLWKWGNIPNSHCTKLEVQVKRMGHFHQVVLWSVDTASFSVPFKFIYSLYCIHLPHNILKLHLRFVAVNSLNTCRQFLFFIVIDFDSLPPNSC